MTQLAQFGVGVIGASGYSGGELARLLLAHPRLEGRVRFYSRLEEDEPGSPSTPLFAMQPQLARPGVPSPMVDPYTWASMRADGTELLLLATPHETSRWLVPQALAHGVRVVDLSGAWRLHDPANAAVYGFEEDAATQREAVFGAPEFHTAAIRSAKLVANPGCYATSAILALKPLADAGLIDREHGVVIDAKSGVSGAGKKPTARTHFMAAAENLSAYSVFGHRHIGEMIEQTGLAREAIQFTPHLLPIARGILSTIYIRPSRATGNEEIAEVYQRAYGNSPCVRLRRPGDLPEIVHVAHTPFCDLGFTLSEEGRRLVVVSCLDNLLKGAASQAVQNMNLMCGWAEAEGLE